MIRPIVTVPHPVLTQKAQPIRVIDDTIKTLAKDMAETMYDAPGVGLAAPQVGESLRLIVIDVSGKHDPPELITVVNPVIVEGHGDAYDEEGCLSVPDYSAPVERFAEVTVSGLDLEGQAQTWHANGLLAIAFQHEIDHLDGVLFIDRISALKRDFYLKKLKKQRRQEAP